MELRNLTTFVRVAELQSFSRAAQQLGYSQSAVTIQIQQLEGELGTRLFERIGRQVKLTQDGERLLPRALAVMKAVDEASRLTAGQGTPTGSLRIGTAESLLGSVLPPVLMAFGRRCPHVELSTCTASPSQLFQMVRQNEVDLLLFLDERTNFPEWIKAAERQERAVFVAPADHPLAGQKGIPLERLLQEPFLLTEKGISYRYAMEQALASRGLAIRPFLETGSTQLIAYLLRQRIGVSFLPEYTVTEEIAAGRLAILDVDCPPITMWSQLVYHRNKWVTPQMEIFLELMTRCLVGRPA